MGAREMTLETLAYFWYTSFEEGKCLRQRLGEQLDMGEQIFRINKTLE